MISQCLLLPSLCFNGSIPITPFLADQGPKKWKSRFESPEMLPDLPLENKCVYHQFSHSIKAASWCNFPIFRHISRSHSWFMLVLVFFKQIKTYIYICVCLIICIEIYMCVCPFHFQWFNLDQPCFWHLPRSSGQEGLRPSSNASEQSGRRSGPVSNVASWSTLWLFNVARDPRGPSGSNHTPKTSWLVVWNHGILWFSIHLGMSSSQLTNSYFSEG